MLALLWGTGEPAAAQVTAVDIYWQYDAPGEINHIEIGDVNHDGIQEFVVVSGQDNLALIGADGLPLFDQIKFDSDITQIALANIDGSNNPQLEILVGRRNELAALNAAGEPLWELDLTPQLPEVSAEAELNQNEELVRVRDVFPDVVQALDTNLDGRDEILIALDSGRLQLHSGRDGRRIWEYQGDERPAFGAFPAVHLADLDGDGMQDILFAYFTRRGFSELHRVNAAGELVWDHSISGRILSLGVVPFGSAEKLAVGVGSNQGELVVFDGTTGARRWLRTPNKAVSSLAPVLVDGQPLLVAGTAAGSLIAYNQRGQRVWEEDFDPQADRTIGAIQTNLALAGRSDTPPINQQPIDLIVSLMPPRVPRSEPGDTLLLDGQGRQLGNFPSAYTPALSQLLDINGDGYLELLLVNFGSMVLRDPGVGTEASGYTTEWSYRLNARPQTAVVFDLDQDGLEEVIVGADDGRIHLLSSTGEEEEWVRTFDGVISHLAVTPPHNGRPLLVAIHNRTILGEDRVQNVSGIVELLRPDGTLEWLNPVVIDSAITGLMVSDLSRSGRPEIVVGTATGQVQAYSLGGNLLWQVDVGGGIKQLLTIPNAETGRPTVVVGTQADQIVLLNNKGGIETQIQYLSDIVAIEPTEPGNTLVRFSVLTADGEISGLNEVGVKIPQWSAAIEGRPVLGQGAQDGLLVATLTDALYRFQGESRTPVSLVEIARDLGRITSLYWGDLNGDALPDVAVGDQEGEIQIYNIAGRFLRSIRLSSPVFYLNSLSEQTGAGQSLIVVTDNGIVRRLTPRGSRPPLLVNPEARAESNSYSASVTVLNIDGRSVDVSLELFDEESGSWLAQPTRRASRRNETLFWPIADLTRREPVAYRFRFDDGQHSSVVTPTLGETPNIPLFRLEESSQYTLAVLTLALVLVGVIVVRQIRSPSWRTARFYRQVRNQPEELLFLLNAAYVRTKGSPDFLLNLASQARRQENGPLAGFADGLYLFDERPLTGLGIMAGALQTAKTEQRNWRALDVWHVSCDLGHALLEAPNLTELALLRPRLEELIQLQSSIAYPPGIYAELLPVMTSIRDYTRVEWVEDRLAYLQEAEVMLRKYGLDLDKRPASIPNRVAESIAQRWTGLVNAVMEDLRGRPWIVANLKTKRLISTDKAEVVLELLNNGRAAAEDIRIRLLRDPAYVILNDTAGFPVLTAGRQRDAAFTIQPGGEAQFRLRFEVEYTDPAQKVHHFDFADLVHVLAPVREFTPIPNPYAPGTPLRRRSPLFVGRHSLFEFIANNVGSQEQSRVLILVGQRRTGKTSALLRLDNHLPDHLIPVYIDCQSLGVVPGMAALLNEIAWLIADALALQELEVEVPELSRWEADPAHAFLRKFLPHVRELLGNGRSLLLCFDEFEAFENLVNDEILPPTFFPFLRHMMQHSQRIDFVFAGTHRLEEMTTDYWSVLFNIALYRQVGYLEEAAALHLITQPVAPHIVYDDLAIDKIMRVTAGHPYFLQLVCYTLVNRANQMGTGYLTISDVNIAMREMLQLGEVHFAYIWHQSTFTERALLTAIAHVFNNEGVYRTSELVEGLREYNIVLEPRKVTIALGRLVERGILREVLDGGQVLYELRIGLVGLWIAQNKSLARLYEAREGGVEWNPMVGD